MSCGGRFAVALGPALALGFAARPLLQLSLTDLIALSCCDRALARALDGLDKLLVLKKVWAVWSDAVLRTLIEEGYEAHCAWLDGAGVP